MPRVDFRSADVPVMVVEASFWRYYPSVVGTLFRRSLQIWYACIAFSTVGTGWSMSGSSCWESQSEIG
jgi:hypothetical protein